MMPRRYLLLLIPLLMAAVPGQAQNGGDTDGDDLEALLVQVGKEYAKAYITPLVHGWGANQNSGLFHTASIPRARLTLAFGLRAMGTHLNEKDQTFSRVLTDIELNDYLDLQPGDPGFGETGDIVLAGPTVVGNSDTKGTITGYVNGIPLVQQETIEGLVETRWIPLLAPEAQIGGLFGARFSLRWLPEIDLGDFGKTKYLGYGLQWSPNFLLPMLPVDVAIGFFKQEIDLGTVVQTEASSVFLAASKSYALATIYGGLATESSTMKVSYTEENSDVEVEFEMDGAMSSRLTLGATLNLGVKLNAEVGVGKLTVYTAGLLFGF